MNDFKRKKSFSTIAWKTIACFFISGILVSIVARLFGSPLVELGVSVKLGVIFTYVLVFSITSMFCLYRLYKAQVINKSIFIKCLSIAFALLMGLGIFVYYKRNSDRVNIPKAESKLLKILGFVEVWSGTHEEIPGPNFLDVVFALKNDNLNHWESLDILIDSPFDEGKDYWGNPIIYKVRRDADNNYIISLQSYGPNRKDNSGKGDDIIQELKLGPAHK